MTFYAHSRKNQDRSSWQTLQEHLEAVAKLAHDFAPSAWKQHGRVAGLFHDAGKYQIAFQNYIAADVEASNESSRGRGVQHSIVGASLAWRIGPHSFPIALAVQAHHGSLKTVSLLQDAVTNTGQELLQNAERDGLPSRLAQTSIPALPSDVDPFYLALGTRFVFSSLVDADLLDTERWDRGVTREQGCSTMAQLADACEAACLARSSKALRETNSALNRMRAAVLKECLASAGLAPGPFTLTVPTGGGKTLSGLAFALRHAARHGLARVVVVAPYTSILEQMVKVYRDTLGAENVIEHHSNIDPDQETDRNRQASENWDAPVVVTTSVQFFETLYSASKSRCRKLHRIGRSVVFLDEVQTFPEYLLKPIHSVLDLLTERFGASVVHSTATQPRLALRSKSDARAKQTSREIVPSYREHFPVIANRFHLEVMGELDKAVSIKELAAEVGRHVRVLVIVHGRREAEDLARLLGPECLHLSARMCAEHRTAVLDQVRARLAGQGACRLVATQLVEAGVDLDFPVVFRALAGLETLAQAAGRCNRELTLTEPGRFIIFRAPSKPPAPSLQRGLETALLFFREGVPDLADPELFARYSKRLLNGLDSNLDARGVLACERVLDFPEVEKIFRMIEDEGTPVIADYGDAWARVRALREHGPSRGAFRRLQRYTVSLHPQEIARLQRLGVLEPLLPRYGPSEAESANSFVLEEDVAPAVYDDRFGFSRQGGEGYQEDGMFA